MISAKRLREYFDRKYSDKNTARLVIKDIKAHIKYGKVDPTYIGNWYTGLSEGTINILLEKGYYIRRSAESSEIGVAFKETDVGLLYEPEEKSVSKEGEIDD